MNFKDLMSAFLKFAGDIVPAPIQPRVTRSNKATRAIRRHKRAQRIANR